MSGATVTVNGLPFEETVLSTFEKDFKAYLSRDAKVSDTEEHFYAHYLDGSVEEFLPLDGSPRPKPDAAVNTKWQKFSEDLRGINVANIASRYSGQIRQVVQCEFSRGAKSKFSHSFTKSHGLLEFPFPRVVGGDKNQEYNAMSKRKFWIVEICGSGVFIAPVTMGTTCVGCCDVTKYLIPPKQDDGTPGNIDDTKLDLLAYWITKQKSRNENGPVQCVVQAGPVSDAYAIGEPWAADMRGWAFSYSGQKASCVLTNSSNDTGLPKDDFITGQRVDIEFNVVLGSPVTVQSIVDSGDINGRTTVSAPGHTLANGDYATITGANEGDYNSTFSVTESDIAAGTFIIYVQGNPSSPATGDNIKLSNLTSKAFVTAKLTTNKPGKMTFCRGYGGTLWLPDSSQRGKFNPVTPCYLNAQDCDGPVDCYYDGETLIETRWKSVTSSGSHVQVPHNYYTGSDGVTHDIGWYDPITAQVGYQGSYGEKFWTCQSSDITYPIYNDDTDYDSHYRVPCTVDVIDYYLINMGAQRTWGFYNKIYDGTVSSYSRTGTWGYNNPSTRDQIQEQGHLTTYYVGCQIEYTPPGSSTPEKVRSGSVVCHLDLQIIDVAFHGQQILSDGNSGGSAGILFNEEREGFAMLHNATRSFYQSDTFGWGNSVVKHRTESFLRNSPTEPDTMPPLPWTDLDYDVGQVEGPAGFGKTNQATGETLPNDFSTSENSFVCTAMVMAAGGFSETLGLDSGVDADGNQYLGDALWSPFLEWEPTGDWTAGSPLFFMRSAQFYSDPTMEYNFTNGVYVAELGGGHSGYEYTGGFTGIDGYYLNGFVGKI